MAPLTRSQSRALARAAAEAASQATSGAQPAVPGTATADAEDEAAGSETAEDGAADAETADDQVVATEEVAAEAGARAGSPSNAVASVAAASKKGHLATSAMRSILSQAGAFESLTSELTQNDLERLRRANIGVFARANPDLPIRCDEPRMLTTLQAYIAPGGPRCNSMADFPGHMEWCVRGDRTDPHKVNYNVCARCRGETRRSHTRILRESCSVNVAYHCKRHSELIYRRYGDWYNGCICREWVIEPWRCRRCSKTWMRRNVIRIGDNVREELYTLRRDGRARKMGRRRRRPGCPFMMANDLRCAAPRWSTPGQIAPFRLATRECLNCGHPKT